MNPTYVMKLTSRTALLSASALLLALMLTGCGITPDASTAGPGSSSLTAPRISGTVHGGQQPVAGATIQLYAVGTTGIASTATPLLTQTVISDSGGSFNITSLYSCTNTAVYGTDPLVYLTATGGNPGLASNTNNSALVMMTAIGRCSTLTPQTFLAVNEVSTVAAAYALAPFMTDAAHIGASPTFASGLSNAFATVTTLVNPATGIAPGPGALAGEIVPANEINSLADVIAPCINSNGIGAPCSTLFAATTPQTGTAPADTLGALLRIAASPAHNVAAIFNLSTAIAPFQPQLSAAPNDWTVALTFSGNGMSGPAGLAIDASGNAWIANGSGAGVTALSSQGSPLAGAAPYTANNTIFGAQAVAVDRAGNIWVADTLLSSVVKLGVTANQVTGSSTFANGFSGPMSLAVDGGNRIWVANFGDGSLTRLSNSGALLNGGPITSAAIQSPAGVALDINSNVWLTDNSSSSVLKFDNNGNLLSASGFSDGALLAPLGIALDASSRAWVADNGNSAVSLFAADGSTPLAAPVTSGGIALPTAVAIDGAGETWITNGLTSGSVTRIASPTAAPTGGLGSLNTPAAVAVDASGNLWTANSGDNTVTKFVGLAAPVQTPLAANLTPQP